MPKIAIPETEFLTIAAAAQLLVPFDQAAFFAAVADELEGKTVGPGSVGCAIRAAQARFKHPETAHAPHSSHKRW
jgi:hypothetical protein